MIALLLATLAHAQDLAFSIPPAPGPGENPALIVVPTRTTKSLYARCVAGGKATEFNRGTVGEGSEVRLEWARDTKVTHADCFIRVQFTDGDVSEQNVPVDYQYNLPLSIDLSRARADLEAKTVTVSASAPVQRAEVVVYGARKAEIDRAVVELSGGPGEVTIPFRGHPADVVLLEVTLHSGQAWAGFTYSPWFLDIPHEDVLFSSDSDVIAKDEEWKLNKTMEQLKEVVEMYGSVVPVKLYIAGCTDTVGDAAHNAELSLRRASAIARWIRAHGYALPIFVHGFGERLLAVQTGDNVDMLVNRRALYMVGANPPPAGSGIPGVGWSAVK
jgi:outer membrane protein OmpA-like peptidoglycan-associated protein